MKYSISVDMDGVLTDFDKQLAELLDKPLDRDYDFGNDPRVWAKITKAGEDFWATMEWMPDGHKLWDAVKKYDPTILSSPSNHISSVEGKKIWLKKNLPRVPYIIEKNKEKHADKGSILIDDREKNIKKWEEAGGVGILHKDADNTITKLETIMDDKEKEATAFKPVTDEQGRKVMITRERLQDTFTPNQLRSNVVPPARGKDAPYNRQENKRVDRYPDERSAMAGRVVLSYLNSDGLTEKTAFLSTIKDLMKSIPAAANIRSKEDAMVVVWDFVKKIGVKKVLEVFAAVEKAMMMDPTGMRTAAVDGTVGQYVKSSMYPLLFLAALMLYMFVGKPQVEHLKQQLHTVQQQQASSVGDIE